MGKIVSNDVFTGTQTSGSARTAVIEIGTGTAELQALNGIDEENDTWVIVPDSTASVSTVYTFYACPGMKYRWVMTGDATGYQSS